MQPVANEERVKWFREAKLGILIHWGLYSQAAGVWKGAKYYGIGEWLMARARIPVSEYEALAASFNPVRFDAKEWADVAQAMGARYLVITAKHHDGFAMYRSKASRYNIVDATPFGRDPMAELAEACRDAGIKLCFYYSQYQDWHEPGGGGNGWEFPESAQRFEEYFETKCKPQVRELLTQYGPLGLIWFDTPGPMTPVQSLELVGLVHALQPECLVSNRVGNDAGDYAGLGDHELPTETLTLPWETPFTHNDSWGYVWYDENWRSTRELVRMLARVNGKGGNLLLNVGPLADGTIPEQSVRVFGRIGEWIRRNAEAVYGTAHSPLAELPWGECTSRPGALYLHVLDQPEDRILRVPGVQADVRRVSLLDGGAELPFESAGHDLRIALPGPSDRSCASDPSHVANTVVKLEYSGELAVDSTRVVMPGSRNTLGLPEAALTGKAARRKLGWMEEFGNWKHALVVEGWESDADAAEWTFRVAEPGEYRISMVYSNASDERREVNVEVAGRVFWVETLITGREAWHFHTKSVGVVAFERPGVYQLRIRPAGPGGEPLKLRDITLEAFS